MFGVLLTAHGNYASGVYSGYKLIAGEAENVRVIDFVEGMGFEELDKKILEAYEELKKYDGVIILTDLAGGTPFNRSVINFSENENVRVFSGLNFPMIFEAVNANNVTLDKISQIIVEGGKSAVMMRENIQKQQPDEDMEDGI